MTEYSVLYPTNDLVKYTSATPDIEYVKNDVETLFGPINAPKLYAQELDTLELASSGKVAFTLSNSHAMDLLTDGSDVMLRARDSLSLKFITESSNVSITLDESTDSLEARASSNVTIISGNDALFAASNSLAISSPSVDVASSSLQVDSSDIGLVSSNLDIASSNVGVRASDLNVLASNITLDSSNFLHTSSNFRIASTNLVLESTTLAQNAQDLVIGASNSLDLAGGNVVVGSQSNVLLEAPSNVIVNTDEVFISATSATRIAGGVFEVNSGDRTIFASSNDTIVSSSGGDVLVQADKDLTLESVGAGDVRIKTPNDRKTIFDVGGANVMELYRTEFYDSDSACNLTNYKFKINADLEVLGTTNSISVSETTLSIEDKVVHLAFNSNLEHPFDGTTNDGAGIEVDGMPESGNPAFYERYEKSIKWFHGTNGIPALGGNDITGESFWNVRGGGLRITQVDDSNGDQVAFGFRINALQELEIYKMVTPNGGVPATARVAKLGRSVVP